MDFDPSAPRIVPEPLDPDPRDEESLAVWGFRDSAFRLRPDGVVQMTGERYELSGQELPELLGWVQDMIHPDVRPDDRNPSCYPPAIPAPRVNREFVEEAGKIFASDQMVDDPEVRLRHGHGHTQEEMFRIKYGSLERVPDLVVEPESEEQIEALVQAALRHDVCLVPYGGGTNVTDALRCRASEERMIVSVDMKRMRRILWIDPVNRLACIEAGAVGRHIVEGLARHGFTLGHEPDSVEFSTLGGWVATHCSGMKKNRYGNIEDIVLDVSVVSARGVLERPVTVPRESVGSSDPRRWIFGSEGCLGIVTRAVVRIHPIPEVQEFGSVVFPDFESGFHFLYALQSSGRVPASVRLVDNTQFQLSQMLKPRAHGPKKWKSRLEKLFITRLKGFDVDRMSACTIVFEGSREEVEAEKKNTWALAKRHGGVLGGAENGRRGYQLTYGIAYIRDWILDHWLLAESFETSVPWSQALTLYENVKRRLAAEHAAHGLPGKPFVTGRITQLYPTGVCIYFYYAFYFKGVERPSEVYSEIEHAARDEVLRSGGSLSHHHGVGKIRQPFLSRVASPGILAWGREIKRAVDATNVFGAGNQLFGLDDAAARPADDEA